MPGFNIVSRTSGKSNDGYNPASGNNTVETARRHRWEVNLNPNADLVNTLNAASGFHTLDPASLTVINFFAKSVTLPDTTYDEIIIHNGQDKIFRPGKRTSKPVDITFYEVITKTNTEVKNGVLTPNGRSKSVMQQLRALTPNSINSSFINPVEKLYFPTVEIFKLDGFGQKSSAYRMYSCYIEKISESDLDYTSSEICEISVTLKYNRYEQFNDWSFSPKPGV